MKRLFLIIAALFCTLPALAQQGYVVKVEGSEVYLDLGRASGAKSGDRFTIFVEGETLKHPVTGENLGAQEKTIGQGKIDSVHEKYSIGSLTSSTGSEKAAPAQRVRLLPAAAPAAPAAAAAPASGPNSDGSSTRLPVFKSPAITDLASVDIAAGDVDGDGRMDAVLAGDSKVRSYPLVDDAAGWKPNCSYADDAVKTRYLSLEAADLDSDGKAEVFATLYNEFFKRVETQVLACEGGTFRVKSVLPLAVRSYKNAAGQWRLAAQQLLADRSFPFGAVYHLTYADGAYKADSEKISHNYLEWIYGFAFARVNEEDALTLYDRRGRIRIIFKKGKWSTPEPYGQTAERVDWHDNKLQFHPRLIAEQVDGQFVGVHTLKNIAAAYGMAAGFGLYREAELYYLRWNGIGLEPVWKSPIGGYASGLAEYAAGPGQPARFAVTVRGSNGATSVWLFDK